MTRGSRVLLAAALCLGVAGARAQPLPCLEVPRAVAVPTVRPWEVPAAPFPALNHLPLDGTPQTEVVALTDGGLAVGLGRPPQVVFLGPEGEPRSRAQLASVPRSLSAWHHGRVLVDDGSGQTLVIAPDGTPRSALTWRNVRDPGPWLAVASGGAVRLVGLDASTELQRIDAAGDLRGSSVVPPRLTGAALLDGETLVYASNRGLVRVAPDGTWSRSPAVPGVRAVVRLEGGGLALSADDAVFFASDTGSLVARCPLEAPTHRMETVAGGVVVTLLGTPARALRIDRDGAVRWRAEVPTADIDLHFDRHGAALGISPTGTLLAFGPDGVERWRMSLGSRVVPPAVITPDGGVLVATVEGGVVRVGPEPSGGRPRSTAQAGQGSR